MHVSYGLPAVFAAALLPLTAPVLGEQLRRQRAVNSVLPEGTNDVEDARAITGITIRPNRDDCRATEGWEVAGPSPIGNAPFNNNWLCVRRDRTAEVVVHRLGFLVRLAAVPLLGNATSSEASFLRKADRSVGHSRSAWSLSQRVLVARMAEDGAEEEPCAPFGNGWELVQGIAQVGAGDRQLRLCAELLGREQASSLISASSFVFSSAKFSNCYSSGAGGDRDIVAMPGFSIDSLMDDAPIICLQYQSNEAQLEDSIDKNQLATREPRTCDPSPIQFTSTAVPELVQGERDREHFLVVGPETSGTRLWSQIIAKAKGFPDTNVDAMEFPDFREGDNAFVGHVSLPWGGICDSAIMEPTYQDYNAQIMRVGGLPARWNLDIVSLVEHYRERGEKLQVLVVVRDPRVSLIGKQVLHCPCKERAKAEQHLAFELVDAAVAAQLPEVTPVCYEDLMQGGHQYIEEKLQQINVVATDLPTIEDRNSEHALDIDADEVCTDDMKAYMRICPRSPVTAAFADICS